MNVTIRTNGKEVASSGIINLENNEFKIEINNIAIIFEFITDSENNNTRFTGSNDNENILRLKIYNMNNAFLEGFYSPIRIGIVDNREFFINFSAWSLDSKKNIRTVAFNLLLGDSVDDAR